MKTTYEQIYTEKANQYYRNIQEAAKASFARIFNFWTEGISVSRPGFCSEDSFETYPRQNTDTISNVESSQVIVVGIIGLLLNASALYTILRGNTGLTGGTGGASKSTEWRGDLSMMIS